jgi:hypothetical protein
LRRDEHSDDWLEQDDSSSSTLLTFDTLSGECIDECDNCVDNDLRRFDRDGPDEAMRGAFVVAAATACGAGFDENP